jgi:hypothetical protein
MCGAEPLFPLRRIANRCGAAERPSRFGPAPPGPSEVECCPSGHQSAAASDFNRLPKIANPYGVGSEVNFRHLPDRYRGVVPALCPHKPHPGGINGPARPPLCHGTARSQEVLAPRDRGTAVVEEPQNCRLDDELLLPGLLVGPQRWGAHRL